MARAGKAMKRSASNELALERPSKKSWSMKSAPITTTTITISRAFIRTLQQYGLLELILSHLDPDDLKALVLASKGVYEALFPRKGSLANVLAKLSCGGKGIQIRNKRHDFFPSTSKDRSIYVQCGSTTSDRTVETRPCERCKVNTCNECRIHLIYQTTYEPPDSPGSLPTFGGFVLLEPAEVNLLSPSHFSISGVTDARQQQPWQNPSTHPNTRPHHDIPNGYLDLPYTSTQPGHPVSLTHTLDYPLSLSPRPHTRTPEAYRALISHLETRILHVCARCHIRALKGPAAMDPPLPQLSWITHVRLSDADADDSTDTDADTDGDDANHHPTTLDFCTCTLRNQFVERWLCVACYDAQDAVVKSVREEQQQKHGTQCRCGVDDADQGAEFSICMWCWGLVGGEGSGGVGGRSPRKVS